MKKTKLIAIISLSIIGLLFISGVVNNNIKKADAAITPTTSIISGFVWSDNIGWISFNSADTSSTVTYGVKIDNSTGNFSGYAWSDNIGWVDSAPTSGYPAPPYHGAQLESDGSVTGWMKALSSGGGWGGWVSLGGTNYGVKVTGTIFSDYAWGSDVLGWLDFSGLSITPSTTTLVAVNDSASVNESSFVNISVLDNDIYSTGTTITGVSTPSNGSVVNNITLLRYINTGYGNGTDQFTYTITDGAGTQKTATVNITIYKCGDGIVQLNEVCDSGVSNGICPATCSTSCTINSCSNNTNTTTCGDAICSSDESFFTCPADCSSSFKEF